MEILGGTAGWSYDDWVGPFYPEHPPKSFSRLEYYSNYFDCVEVDSTFYRHFPPKVAEKWLSEVDGNRDFVFLTKLYKSFTHGVHKVGNELNSDRRIVMEFLQPFMDQHKLGGVLVQFSEYFRDSPSSRDYLSFVSDQFRGIRLFFELRHTSWYTMQAGEFLRERSLSAIAIDQPLLKGMVGFIPEIVGETGYFRLHGRNKEKWAISRKTIAEGRAPLGVPAQDEQGRNDRYNYLYSGEELDEIEGKIRRVAERCKRIYVVTNNHPMGKAVANALELVKRLRNQERVRMPDTVIKYFPELERMAERVNVTPKDSLF
jgi:uncharacterized protein YecE (DUF72 family)